MFLFELEKQLIKKKRTVAELADIIELRSDQSPNYSVLLGAGCSVSSDVRSGNDLINEWRSEFCNQTSNVEEQKIYLKQQHSDWYDPMREYSSLFEKKFDLQRHRRMFVERQVAGKTPSIGYAYLTSLVKANYFHTLFTTNFDDLINEAFYLYSDQRPIVCAHDSSINSVTVTSSRPKIIKLHGDYLFDDIKATVRETESLEQNMKAKFAEFAKDFGLIVVGYSGYDRSIMDVISVLLRNEAYFNNGIYWCLRKDSEISEELKKILWRDKVYFVEIEGFDELFAEIHTRFNSEGTIPISTSSVSRKPVEIINKLLESQSFINSSSPILRKAYEQLLKESKRTVLMDLILPRDKEETNGSKESLSDDEIITRIEIQKLISTGDYREVIEKGRSAIQSGIKASLKPEILKYIIRAHRALGNVKEAVSIVDELIADEPYLATHLLLKAEILISHQEKLEALNKAIEVNRYWYKGHYKKAVLFSEFATKSYGKDRENAVKEALEAVEEGLAKDPSLDNPCWATNFQLISNYEKDRPAREAKQTKIIDSLNNMNPESALVLSLRMSMLSAANNQSAIKSLITDIDQLKQKILPRAYPVFDEIRFKGLQKIDDLVEISKRVKETLATYDDLTRHPDLAVAIATVIRNKLGKDEEAIELLRTCYSADFDQEVVSSLISALIDVGRLPEAEEIFKETFELLSSELRHGVKLQILEAKEDYHGALVEIKKRVNVTGESDDLDLYYLIKNRNYAAAEKIGRELLERINFSKDATFIIVNYELACYRQKGKCSQSRLEDAMQFDTSCTVKAAIYAILGKKNEMIVNLKKAISNDKSFRFTANRWPAFENFQKDAEFIKAITIKA